MTDFVMVLGVISGLYLTWELFNKVIFPKMVYRGMKEIDRNPKWITSKLQYYGFDDIDIVLCESKWGMLPRFRTGKDNRLELWIDNDTSTRDVDDVGHLALCVKVKVKYGLWFPDKPTYWLSILLYMLDGGNIEMREKEKQETS